MHQYDYAYEYTSRLIFPDCLYSEARTDNEDVRDSPEEITLYLEFMFGTGQTGTSPNGYLICVFSPAARRNTFICNILWWGTCKPGCRMELAFDGNTLKSEGMLLNARLRGATLAIPPSSAAWPEKCMLCLLCGLLPLLSGTLC